jgi:hypothetical protein
MEISAYRAENQGRHQPADILFRACRPGPGDDPHDTAGHLNQGQRAQPEPIRETRQTTNKIPLPNGGTGTRVPTAYAGENRPTPQKPNQHYEFFG